MIKSKLIKRIDEMLPLFTAWISCSIRKAKELGNENSECIFREMYHLNGVKGRVEQCLEEDLELLKDLNSTIAELSIPEFQEKASNLRAFCKKCYIQGDRMKAKFSDFESLVLENPAFDKQLRFAVKQELETFKLAIS